MKVEGPAQTPPIPPTSQSAAEKLARSSFVGAILSIFCGITALPAIIQSIRALVRIRKDGVSKATRLKVIFSLIFSSCVFVFFGFIYVSLVVEFRAAQVYADQFTCVNTMKQLGLAFRVYEEDQSDMFPPNQWCDALLNNKRVTTNFSVNGFLCPAANKNQRSSYALNHNLVGIKDDDKVSKDTVLIFESDAGWNAIGGPEIATARHYGSRLTVVLVDGSVHRIEIKDIGNLRWNPYTNASASAGK
jgi:hypothetical protein